MFYASVYLLIERFSLKDLCILQANVWKNSALAMHVCAHNGLGLRFKMRNEVTRSECKGGGAGIPAIALEKLALFSSCIDLDFMLRVPWHSSVHLQSLPLVLHV